ncbi:MAG: CBS domain-containing protein [Cyclobacteriaceae bacterium]
MNFQGRKVEDNTKGEVTYESVTKYMARDLITFSPDQEIQDAIDVMLDKRISGAPVLNEKKELIGMLSEKDCLRVIVDARYHNQPNSKGSVSDYMSKNVKTISVDKDVVEVADEFLSTQFRRFPVVDDKGVLKGQVSRRDIMRAARELKGTTW